MDCPEIVALWILAWCILIALVIYLRHWFTDTKSQTRPSELPSKDYFILLLSLFVGLLSSVGVTVFSMWVNCAYIEGTCDIKSQPNFVNPFTPILGIFIIVIGILVFILRCKFFSQLNKEKKNNQ